VISLHEAYVRLDAAADSAPNGPVHDYLVDLSEQENANSLEVMNALLAEESDSAGDIARLRDTRIGAQLREISEDLDSRWRGALFALHPGNPDASRHFCASSREIITGILEKQVPDDIVRRAVPNCPTTEDGRVTRRAKIEFALSRKGISGGPFVDFVQQDVDNIVELFRVLNDGTHGSAGRFDFQRLVTIKQRVEDGIVFLRTVLC